MLKSPPPVRKEKPEQATDSQRVVLDTNVLVSAFLSPLGTPGQVVFIVLQGRLQTCYNPKIINEYKEVLARPKFRFELSAEQIQFTLETLQQNGFSYNVSAVSTFFMKDESDRIFYDTSKAAGALLITGNIKHYPSEPFIITPRDFMNLYGVVRGV